MPCSWLKPSELGPAKGRSFSGEVCPARKMQMRSFILVLPPCET